MDYSQHLNKASLPVLLPKAMQAHHASVVTRVLRGEFSIHATAFDSSQSEEGPGSGIFHGQSRRPSPLAAGQQPREMAPTVATSAPASDANNHPNPLPAAEATLPSIGITAGTTTSPRSAWDRVVEHARRDRLAQQTSAPVNSQVSEGAKVTLSASKQPAERQPVPDSRRTRPNAARAGQQAAVGRVGVFDTPTPRTPRDPALTAYETGVEQMRKSDKRDAVASFARAVELEPTNKRYRVALRRCLDWLDAREG